MVRPSVILSVRYRNHFPIVQFQNQAHIWNPRGTGHVFKPFGAPQAAPERGARGAPNFFPLFYRRRRRRKLPLQVGCPGRSNFFFSYCHRRQWFPKGGAGGATHPEGEGNPAVGGYFASMYINIKIVFKLNIYMYI